MRRVFLVKSIPTSAYTQLNSCISVTPSHFQKKTVESSFFLTVLNSWLVVWSPRPERIDNVAGMRTAPRHNSAPCTVQVVCRHGALDLMPPLCPNRQERRCNPPFSTRMSRLKSCAASGKWSAASEAHSLCGCVPRGSYRSECANPLSCLCLTAASSLELRWLRLLRKERNPSSRATHHCRVPVEIGFEPNALELTPFACL